MSPRTRSWIGGLLFAVGIFTFFGGALFPGLAALAYAGAAAVVVALVFIGSAVRDVNRQIGQSHARFEALLRSEAERDRNKPAAP